MQFRSFHWLSYQCSTKLVKLKQIFLECFQFYFSLDFFIFWLYDTFFFLWNVALDGGVPFPESSFFLIRRPIGVKLLASAIKSDRSVKGLSLNSEDFKLSPYADDKTCLIEDTSSASNLFKQLDLFRLRSGLVLNRLKTKALLLDSNKNQLKPILL